MGNTPIKENIWPERMAGILMPVASLPSRDGVGGFGREAYEFVDMLSEMHIGIWQILPLNPLGFGNSPYQPFSSYAGDEIYVDLGLLEEEGYLKGEREPYQPESASRIQYEKSRQYKTTYLKYAYEEFYAKSWQEPSFLEFREMEWVYPYAVFMALKKQNSFKCWNEWPKEQQDWSLDHKYDIGHLQEEIQYQMFVQYIFYKQWLFLKQYANEKNVLVMGDVPFYVGLDSADVWSHREDFLLDSQWQPIAVAGVPPDYFSKTGQRWGNPVYNWENLKKNHFTFWVNRLKYMDKLCDIIRIDHFRAFDTYWKIQASCETAVDGEWAEAPGYEFFDELYRKLPDIRIVAEDLGNIRPEVLKLRDHYGLPGMNIAEFSILSADEVKKHQLIYTGTHDNQTVKGWYTSLGRKEKGKAGIKLAEYGHPKEPVSRKMLRYVFESKADLAIVPVMDILGLDDAARINTPGTVGNPNWEWKLAGWGAFRKKMAFVRELVSQSGRNIT